jgi:site-specific DNA recombinase
MSDIPSPPTTPKALYKLMKQGMPEEAHKVDTSKLRYVIYARKSTTGEDRQERSIGDQIHDCMEKVVKVHNLQLVGAPIEERCSAKEPDIRPKFRQLLNDIENEKIDGIITWHPDRLSRNMKEAGEIIDLLGKGRLRDLQFATSSFENTPTGKMLLGISFVLSQQYSEHLSESVTRGNRRKTEDGIFISDFKHGYYMNNGQFIPDGNNFAIIQEAFRKRIEGMSQRNIMQWLNTTGYQVHKKGKDPEPYKWDNDAVSKLFRDSLYTGVLKYGKAVSNLEDHYDFIPAITVEDFLKINKIDDFNSAKLISAVVAKKESTKADLLRKLVFCGYCNRPFSSGLTSKVLKKEGKIFYYNYKCETDGCEFKFKSVRANVVLNYAYDFLDTFMFTTESNYEVFIENAKVHAAQRTKELTSSIMSLTKVVGEKQLEYDHTKRLLMDSPHLEKHYDLDGIEKELNELKDQHKKLIDEKQAIKPALLTYKQYLELFESIGVKLDKSHDMAMIDKVLRNFFSNFTIKASGVGKQRRYEITHKLKEPWDGFLKNDDFVCGRGERTRTFDLAVPNRAR